MKTKIKTPIKNNPFSASNETVKLTPGRYLVVDPCYVVPNEMWLMVCNLLPSDRESICLTYASHKFFVQSTAYGDGSYSLSNNANFVGTCGVDAGLLSIIPESLVKLWKSEENYSGVWPDMGGVWVDIAKDTEVKPYGTGNFKFGPFDMNTEGTYDDND